MYEGGVVIIGRNEGERLKICIQSVLNQTSKVVYVDSESTDGSLVYAVECGIHVISLDKNMPFSASRARNEGFAYLAKKYGELGCVQFIDGDCELLDGWLETAEGFLLSNPSWGLVAGRVRERFPEYSIYNLLCDIEWNTVNGEVEACGGIFCIRQTAFSQSGGFNIEVIAGEEPELCFRLREKGWKIFRIERSMVLHDAGISKFTQWWKRAVRSGHAYAQGCFLHHGKAGGYCLRDTARIWFWAFFLPCSILFFSTAVSGKFLLLLILYCIQFVKVALHLKDRAVKLSHSFIYSGFLVVGKFAQLVGQMIFLFRHIVEKKYEIIEYK
jgi:GT2 family glycosyltransferase